MFLCKSCFCVRPGKQKVRHSEKLLMRQSIQTFMKDAQNMHKRLTAVWQFPCNARDMCIHCLRDCMESLQEWPRLNSGRCTRSVSAFMNNQEMLEKSLLRCSLHLRYSTGQPLIRMRNLPPDSPDCCHVSTAPVTAGSGHKIHDISEVRKAIKLSSAVSHVFTFGLSSKASSIRFTTEVTSAICSLIHLLRSLTEDCRRSNRSSGSIMPSLHYTLGDRSLFIL